MWFVGLFRVFWWVRLIVWERKWNLFWFIKFEYVFKFEFCIWFCEVVGFGVEVSVRY